MTVFEIISIAVSGFALVVSIFSIVMSARQHGQTVPLQQASLELEIRAALTSARERVEDIILKHGEIFEAIDTGRKSTKGDAYQRESAIRLLDSAKENLVNSYEESCSKYIDKKVDRIRFKKTYQHEIRDLVENELFESYFKQPQSRYKAILKVYEEWENPEI